MTDLSSRLASGDTLYGTFLGLGSALAAEACALAGFDWLLTDLEHGGGDESELLPQQLAADAHAVPMLVRVESTHRIRAGHALDLGAAGIMFPGIESADQATQAIRHLRYPPDGDRGVATYNRAYGFGLPPERLETANERILGIVQIESKQAVDRVEEITKVPGIHVLFIGPRHLSHDLGVPGDTSAPAFQDALQRAFWPPPRPQASPRASPRESSLPTPRPRAGTPTKACASSSSALTPPCSPSPANTPSTASTAPEHPGEKDQDRGGDAQRVRRAV